MTINENDPSVARPPVDPPPGDHPSPATDPPEAERTTTGWFPAINKKNEATR